MDSSPKCMTLGLAPPRRTTGVPPLPLAGDGRGAGLLRYKLWTRCRTHSPALPRQRGRGQAVRGLTAVALVGQN